MLRLWLSCRAISTSQQSARLLQLPLAPAAHPCCRVPLAAAACTLLLPRAPFAAAQSISCTLGLHCRSRAALASQYTRQQLTFSCRARTPRWLRCGSSCSRMTPARRSPRGPTSSSPSARRTSSTCGGRRGDGRVSIASACCTSSTWGGRRGERSALGVFVRGGALP